MITGGLFLLQNSPIPTKEPKSIPGAIPPNKQQYGTELINHVQI